MTSSRFRGLGCGWNRPGRKRWNHVSWGFAIDQATPPNYLERAPPFIEDEKLHTGSSSHDQFCKIVPMGQEDGAKWIYRGGQWMVLIPVLGIQSVFHCEDPVRASWSDGETTSIQWGWRSEEEYKNMWHWGIRAMWSPAPLPGDGGWMSNHYSELGTRVMAVEDSSHPREYRSDCQRMRWFRPRQS